MKEQILAKINSLVIIFIFCTLIFIPFTIGIIELDKEISAIEKRTLVKLPEFPNTIEGINKFPQLFDKYYADHFGLRYWFTKYYKLVKYRIGDSPSENVTIGKNGWLFLGSIKNNKHHDPMGDVRNVNLFSQLELKKFAKYLMNLKAWLNKQGIEYIFLIAPNKHTIYFDQLPNYISKVNKISAMEQLVGYLKKHTDVKVIDLKQPLLKAKNKYQLYSKTGTHWNKMGANIAQYEIMKAIQLFPIQPELYDSSIFKSHVAHDRGLEMMMNIKFDPPPYALFPRFKKACKPTKISKKVKGIIVETLICKNKKFNAIIFRDSFFNALQPYFARKFNRSTYIWEKINYLSLKKHIELEQPNIVIEEWVERVLPHLPKDINSMPYAK